MSCMWAINSVTNPKEGKTQKIIITQQLHDWKWKYTTCCAPSGVPFGKILPYNGKILSAVLPRSLN